MARIGVITGLSSEADCFNVLTGDDRPRVLCSGANAERAWRGAQQLVQEGCEALVSFGLAGGLAPELKPGSLVVGDAVITPDGRHLETDPRWRRRLVGRLAAKGIPAEVATLAASDEPLLSPRGKQLLQERTGAALVDMESHAVAETAFEFGLPLLVLRGISDPSSRTVPAWVMDCVLDDGRINPGKAAFEAMCRPWDIPALGLLAFESGQALTQLSRVVGLLGPRLGLD